MADEQPPKEELQAQAPEASAPAEAPAGAPADAPAGAPADSPAAAPAAAGAATIFVPGAPSGLEQAAPKTDSELQAAIRKQVEYYFSDANFAKDKFLQIETAKSEGQWIDITVLNRFNRMKVLVPSLKPEPIAAALKDSEVLELSDCGTKIRRHPSLWKSKPVTLGGKVYNSRSEVIAMAQPLLKTSGDLGAEAMAFVKDLLQHHSSAKEKEGSGIVSIKAGCNPQFPDTKCFVLVRSDGTEEDFSYIKCVNNMFPQPAEAPHYMTRKRKAESSLEGPRGKRGPAAGSSAGDDGGPDEMASQKGKIVVVRDLVDGQSVSSMKAAFGVAGNVRFVEIVPDQPLAYVRFESSEHAKKALDIGGMGDLSLLDGDDEKEYLEKISSSRDSKGRGGGRGRGRGRKGFGGGKGKGGGRGRGRGRPGGGQ